MSILIVYYSYIGKKLAHHHDWPFFETSAVSGLNIQAAMAALLKNFRKHYEELPPPKDRPKLYDD